MLLLENGDTERTTAFADTIELALALRADGTVAGILIGANQETPAYLDFVREDPFFCDPVNQFKFMETVGDENAVVYGLGEIDSGFSGS